MMEDYVVFVYLIAEPPLENKFKESGAGDTEMMLADSFTKASVSMYDWSHFICWSVLSLDLALSFI